MKFPEGLPAYPDLNAAHQDLKHPWSKARLIAERSVTWGDGWGTHIPLLATAVARLPSGSGVLELGAGMFSTPLLHTMCHGWHALTTLENNPGWAAKFSDLGHPDLRVVPSVLEALKRLDLDLYDLVFVDSQPDEDRIKIIEHLHQNFDGNLVVHDTLNPYFVGVDEVLDTYKHRTDYVAMTSCTSYVSDHVPL